MALHDEFQLINQPTGQVLPEVFGQRIVESMGDLQVVALGVVGGGAYLNASTSDFSAREPAS